MYAYITLPVCDKMNKELIDMILFQDLTFQSGAIVIKNTVYTGGVIPNYSHILRKWDAKKSFPHPSEPFNTELMSTELENIDFQLGYPYLYIHNPNCEHLLVFRNVR